MKLCREYDGEFYPVDLPWSWTWRKIHGIKYKIINQLNRDTKHARICKLIHRHIKPQIPIDFSAASVDDALKKAGNHYARIVYDDILGQLGVPWNCVRCGEKQELKLSVDIDSISKWKDYAKIVDVPYLKVDSIKVPGPAAYGPMPTPEPTNLSDEKK